jgi:carbamoyltransferase
MKLLALRLCEHDSNISYFDGNTLRYFKSERHTQQKHHAYHNLWEWKNVVREIWGLDYNDLNEIAIVLDPWSHKLPRERENFLPEDKNLIGHEKFFPALEYDHFPAKCKVWRVNHHYAHALSGWMMGESDVQFVFDGYGDWDVSWTVFRDNKVIDIGSVQKNGSLGISMATAGRNLGIQSEKDDDIAGKLMALQSYGKYEYDFAKLISRYSIRDINSLFKKPLWFNYKKDPTLGAQTSLDWISTVHKVVGEKLVEFFEEFASSGDRIFYSGGVALNVLWNSEIKKHFPNLIVAPHCADEGLSLGAIEWLRIKNNLPKFELNNFPFNQTDDVEENISDETIDRAAKLLAEGKTIAWVQGNGELGPRALGHRSILLDPRILNGQDRINSIKRREAYRPFGCSILAEFKNDYFHDLPDNPYMLYVGHIKDGEKFPAITHIDGTCRAQTVDKTFTSFYNLLYRFYELTGCPLLLNTSYNISNKPIVGSYQRAVNTYYGSPQLDALVIGNDIMDD